MKFKTEYLNFKTDTRYAFVNITPKVRKIIEESKIQEGLCLVNSMHISSSIFIIVIMKTVCMRILENGWQPAPHNPINQYKHNDTGEDNADAHLKRQIMEEVVIAITNGKLDFGLWEQIFYGEFDGQRNKRVLMKVIGE